MLAGAGEALAQALPVLGLARGSDQYQAPSTLLSTLCSQQCWGQLVPAGNKHRRALSRPLCCGHDQIADDGFLILLLPQRLFCPFCCSFK